MQLIKAFLAANPRAKSALIHALKVGAVGLGSTLLAAASEGAFGPRGTYLATAVTGIIALYLRSPLAKVGQ